MKSWNRREILGWMTGSAWAVALPMALPVAGAVMMSTFDHRRFRFGMASAYRVLITLPEGQTDAHYMAALPGWLDAKAYDDFKAEFERDGRILRTTKRVVGRELEIKIEFRANHDVVTFERKMNARGLVNPEVRRSLGYFVREELVMKLG